MSRSAAYSELCRFQRRRVRRAMPEAAQLVDEHTPPCGPVERAARVRGAARMMVGADRDNTWAMICTARRTTRMILAFWLQPAEMGRA